MKIPDALKRTVSDEFMRWFGKSKVTDAEGNPAIAYRGQRRVPNEEKFVMTQGRATPSFTLDPEVANVYSRQFDNWGEPDYGPGSNVVPAFISMQNPLDLRRFGEIISLEDLVDQLPNVNLARDYIEGGVGYGDLYDMFRGLDSVVAKTGARANIDAGTGIHRITEFSELADEIESAGAAGDVSNILDNLLFNTTIDTYTAADSKNITRKLKELGYDGLLLNDVFDAGAGLYRGDPKNLKEGIESDAVVEAIRPFYQTSIKSIFNRGTFDPKNPNIMYGAAPFGLLMDEEDGQAQ